MRRFQVTLPEPLYQRLSEEAKNLDMGVPELVRRHLFDAPRLDLSQPTGTITTSEKPRARAKPPRNREAA